MSPKERAPEVCGEFQVSHGERARAVRVVAAVSANADECREVLSMLGLDPAEARQIPEPRREGVATPVEERSTA
jgi:hypothetical protein